MSGRRFLGTCAILALLMGAACGKPAEPPTPPPVPPPPQTPATTPDGPPPGDETPGAPSPGAETPGAPSPGAVAPPPGGEGSPVANEGSVLVLTFEAGGADPDTLGSGSFNKFELIVANKTGKARSVTLSGNGVSRSLGEVPTDGEKGEKLELEEGEYTVTAKADGAADMTATILVGRGAPPPEGSDPGAAPPAPPPGDAGAPPPGDAPAPPDAGSPSPASN